MIVINKDKPTKLCHCAPGDTVKLDGIEDTFIVSVFGQLSKEHRALTSTGLYAEDRPLFLVSLNTGEARSMPHLSSTVRRVKAYVTTDV